jgi:hypothetical protein
MVTSRIEGGGTEVGLGPAAGWAAAFGWLAGGDGVTAPGSPSASQPAATPKDTWERAAATAPGALPVAIW